MPTDENDTVGATDEKIDSWGESQDIPRALYKTYKKKLIASGVEHGWAVVQECAPGTWSVTGGEGTLESSGFVGGGGSFGGGGASGSW